MFSQNHCRFFARAGSDKWLSTHCRRKPRTDSDVDFHYRFWPAPNHFLIFKFRTGSEGISLPVHPNPAVMRPTVMSESVVVADVGAQEWQVMVEHNDSEGAPSDHQWC